VTNQSAGITADGVGGKQRLAFCDVMPAVLRFSDVTVDCCIIAVATAAYDNCMVALVYT
jgi:hypothetical protein